GWGRDPVGSGAGGVAALPDDPELRSAVQAAVDEANRTVSAAESIRRFRILGRGFAVGEELTPSQKVRRGYVTAKFAADIEALYAPPG
ncbi:long-chain fatty acid--CoA ligase, partial [Streptomyces sp. NPDC001759]